MPRYFTHYWNYKDAIRREPVDRPLDHTAGSGFRKRGITRGAIVYVVSVTKGKLFVLGKLEVGRIVLSDDEARGILGYEPWEAPEHLIASRCTPSTKATEVSVDNAERLRFISSSGRSSLKFVSKGKLDRQTLRGVRELEPESAARLDRLLPGFG